MNDDTTMPIDTTATVAPPSHIRASERFDTVSLEWPVEFGGVVYSSVSIRRMTVAEIEAFTERLKAADASGDASPPRFPMVDIPEVVFAALDVDDADRINEVAARFLPRRYRDDPVAVQPH